MKRLLGTVVLMLGLVFVLHLAVQAVLPLYDDEVEAKEAAKKPTKKIEQVTEQKEYKVPRIVKKKKKKKGLKLAKKAKKKKSTKKTKKKITVRKKNTKKSVTAIEEPKETFFEKVRREEDDFYKSILSAEEYARYEEYKKKQRGEIDKNSIASEEELEKYKQQLEAEEAKEGKKETPEKEIKYKVVNPKVKYSKESKELLERIKKEEMAEIKRGYRHGVKIVKSLWKEAGGDVKLYDILFGNCYNEDGSPRNVVQTDEELAKEMGITLKELKKLEKEGYFNNGVTVSEGGIGDGSPEDDAGMDFQ